MIKVNVFSTRGARKNSLETAAQTWGELKSELKSIGVETDGLRAIIGQTQLTLESAKAVLPDYDFVLFLSPIKVKSGCDINPETMSYKECKEYIKNEVTNYGEAKEHFGNYTIMSTTQMRSLIETWVDGDEEIDAEEATVVELIDHVIDMLEILKDKVESGTVEKDDTDKLELMWKDIENNL
jgi:hypothetical protein